MTRKEIEALENEIVTLDQLEKIDLNPEVTNVEPLGASGYRTGYTWYSVEFNDGTSIDVYTKY